MEHFATTFHTTLKKTLNSPMCLGPQNLKPYEEREIQKKFCLISTHKFLFVSLLLYYYAGDPHQNNAEEDDEDDDAAVSVSLLRRLGFFVQHRDFATGRRRRVRPQGNRLK